MVIINFKVILTENVVDLKMVSGRTVLTAPPVRCPVGRRVWLTPPTPPQSCSSSVLVISLFHHLSMVGLLRLVCTKAASLQQHQQKCFAAYRSRGNEHGQQPHGVARSSWTTCRYPVQRSCVHTVQAMDSRTLPLPLPAFPLLSAACWGRQTSLAAPTSLVLLDAVALAN